MKRPRPSRVSWLWRSVPRRCWLRRGAAAAPSRRAGPPGRWCARGTVEHITVHGKALEGNLEGDSPDREVTVYLPPSYAADQNRRYPVVYLLHGYGGRDDTFTARLASSESGDRLGRRSGIQRTIVVTPNAFTLHKGSMYSNSPTTGDWEKFVAEDLVAYMDSHYRTLADRMSRGLAGHSMGGYGALRIGMKRPDVFWSLYVMSACCLTANRNPRPEAMAGGGSDQDARAGRGGGARAGVRTFREPRVRRGVVAKSQEPAALSRSPGEGGKVRPDIVAKWVANAPLEMLDQHVAEPRASTTRSRSTSARRTPLLAVEQASCTRR